MTPRKSPKKMAAQRIQEIPFTDRITMREKVLAWISSDVGLCDFLVPDALAESWSPEQKQTWTNVIVDNFLMAQNTEVGRVARGRVMAREQAGSLRRGCDKLRQDVATYRDIAKMGVTIEGLWNDISSNLDDPTWAKCSLLFDTALISLRVAYLWLYDKTENNGASVDTRKKVFKTLLDSFFSENAPTDDKEDKHSANFRDLLAVWQTELQKYTEAEDFEEKLDRLEETQPLREVASGIERFLNTVDIDQSWLWKMKLLDDELQNGHIVRKKRGRKSKNDKVIREPSPEPVDEGPPEPPEPESSSFEPAAEDSDFDYEDAEQQKKKAEKEDEDDEDYEDYESSDIDEDLARGMMSETRANGSIVRRSLRVARSGKVKKRSSRPPIRLGESPPRRRPAANGSKRRRATINEVLDEVDADDEPPLAVDSPHRGPTGKYAAIRGKSGTGAIQALKKKLKEQRRRTGRAVRRVAPPTRGSDDDDVPQGTNAMYDDTSEPSIGAPAPLDLVGQRAESAAEARRRRLMAALTED